MITTISFSHYKKIKNFFFSSLLILNPLREKYLFSLVLKNLALLRRRKKLDLFIYSSISLEVSEIFQRI